MKQRQRVSELLTFAKKSAGKPRPVAKHDSSFAATGCSVCMKLRVEDLQNAVKTPSAAHG